jgi:hypothetical protein
MLSTGSSVDPDVCLFIMGLSAQSVVWVVACVASVQYALRVSTTEDLLGRKSSGSGLENRDYGLRDLSR